MPTPDFGALVWMRRDLRLHDHSALRRALLHQHGVHCVFVFDTTLLAPLPRHDRRVAFIHACVQALDTDLRAASAHPGAGLIVLHGDPVDCVPALARQLGVGLVVAAHDYEPAAQQRDAAVARALQAAGIAWVSVKDQVVCEGREVLTQGGQPYSVFTPYKRAWLARWQSAPAAVDPAPPASALLPRPAACQHLPSLEELGFGAAQWDNAHVTPGAPGAARLLDDFAARIDRYAATRDFPALKGPSYLSVHLRFGTVSVRQLVHAAWQRSQGGSAGAGTWLSELVWREFYFQILANYPHVVGAAFKPVYDGLVWEQGAEAERRFAAWCAGATGYPLVDAAMAQINQTGYMHNRLRMVAGSFLVKHLGLDWRWGEAYFAAQLNDFDLAANNGGWQWVASTGCDAQPYFRIFNPVTQSEKFDPDGAFIRRYLPQLAALPTRALHAPWLARPIDLAAAGVRLGVDYPHPVVDHAQARARTLQRYAAVREGGQG